MISNLKKRIDNYLHSDKLYPTVIAIASGLYPMLYCYSKNFSLFNSIAHLLFFLLVFIGLPILVFNSVHWLLKKVKFKKQVLFTFTFLNVCTILFFIKTITYADAQLKKSLFIIIIAFLIAMFLKKHLKKLVVLQYVLAIIGFVNLLFIIYGNFKISNAWHNQPDTIEAVIFKKKPIVYFIQPNPYDCSSGIHKFHWVLQSSRV